MRLLDLFCGAGGAGVGYHRAGFEVVGVDIDDQPNYPFTFHQGDALALLNNRFFAWRYGPFDAVHASPPCQAHTTMSNRYRGQGGVADSWPELLAPIRERLRDAGVPYIIENVPGAKRELVDPIKLTGGMFGLSVERPRLFECSFPVEVPPRRRVAEPVGVYGARHDGRRLWTRRDGTVQRAARTLDEGAEAMGVDWPMTWRELCEAIPPAYTEWVGRQLVEALR